MREPQERDYVWVACSVVAAVIIALMFMVIVGLGY